MRVAIPNSLNVAGNNRLIRNETPGILPDVAILINQINATCSGPSVNSLG